MQLALRNIRGETITFTDPYLMGQVAGLGLPPVTHASTQFTQQDGATLLGVTLQRRVLTVPFEILVDSYATLWSTKRDLYRFLSTVKSPYTWIATLPDGTVRHLTCYYAGELSMPYDPEWGPLVHKDVGQWIAYDPLWFDPESTVWVFVVSGGSGSWIFDLGFPAGFGGSYVDQVDTREYVGSWQAFPVITITGPVDDLVITNVTTGQKLDFTDYDIGAAEVVTIDLTPGVKTVMHSTDGNIPDALTDDSDLGTWHLAPHPDAVDGQNTIQLEGTGANANTRIEIRFNPRYLALAS